VWAFNEDAVRAAESFAEKCEDELGLQGWQGAGNMADGRLSNGQWRKIWWQGQVQHSRKRVAPLLREAMV